MQYAITFLEGVVTFISPCLLPLLPVYVAFFAGGIENGPSADNNAASASLWRTAISAFGFIIGFSLLFVALGAFAGTVGGFFARHQAILNVICGLIVIVMGLHFAGVLNIAALQQSHRLESPHGHGFWSSLLFGMVFAIGWTPCVGAFLASALSLAASTGSTGQGILLLLCYSLGLGVPFFLAAVLIDQLEGAFAWVKKHYRPINIICGAILVLVGILMATGRLGLWISALSVL